MALKNLQTTFFRFSTIKTVSFCKETSLFIKRPRERFFGHMALD